MYIAALNSSYKNDGETSFLLNSVLDICKENGADTEIFNIYEIMRDVKNPFCICCQTPCQGICYKGTKLEEAFKKLSTADAIIIGSPVYFRGVTGQLKAFFDKTRAIRADKAWVGKIGAAISVGGSKYGGQEAVINQIHDMMLVHGMTIVGDGSDEYGAGHSGICAHNPARNDEYAMSRVNSLAYRILEEIKK
ncbi:MAG: flavodoxin family protein [Clostridia bacterium]|nr:flavodoxin family protein [Clostridia bacterium]